MCKSVAIEEVEKDFKKRKNQKLQGWWVRDKLAS
jgi:hypothetical protein